MIRFEAGDVKATNSTVTFGPVEHEAAATRDEEGNITVTFDGIEPSVGETVVLVLHDEGDATYQGVVGEGLVYEA